METTYVVMILIEVAILLGIAYWQDSKIQYLKMVNTALAVQSKMWQSKYELMKFAAETQDEMSDEFFIDDEEGNSDEEGG